jgi:hypothetical protein
MDKKRKEEGKMKKIGFLAALIFVACLFLVSESFAQRGMMGNGSGGWGMGTPYGRMYNPATVETISGEVIGIDKITPMRGMSYGVHMTVKTDKEAISVHLGPGWYMENQDIKIKPKDKIVVKGSRATFDGKPAIIAAEIKKGDDVLKLRDENGYPAWSGWRRR